ncbi:MAG: GDP-mannose 4,6-dehydratase, partial [SAR324 cluster bacterium]|nr:GDP-mannose 4,6-dehydratase [SAR324 cluster bacterium]
TADPVPTAETSHCRPETIYGASKLTGEYYTQVFQRSGWLETVIARPYNNYGPREHYAGYTGEVIPRFILWALAGQPLIVHGDGRQTRDFTYVEETADYLVRLLEQDACVGETINVCRGREVSIGEIARLIVELTGSASRPQHIDGRPSDVLRLYGDPSLLRERLGGSPEVSIREGLTRTIAWFREHVFSKPGVLQTIDSRSWDELPGEPWMPKSDS